MRAAVRCFPLLLAACIGTADNGSHSQAGGCSSSSPGALEVGDFDAVECAGQIDCLHSARMASGSVARMTFQTSEPLDVERVISTAPAVLTIDRFTHDGDRTTFDVTAGDSGATTVRVLDGGHLIDEIAVTVEEVQTVDVFAPTKLVLGGRSTISSEKHGLGTAPLFGRGGYDLSAPAGLAIEPAAFDEEQCNLVLFRSDTVDFTIRGDAVGSYPLAVSPRPIDFAGTIEVVPPAEVVSAFGGQTWAFQPSLEGGGYAVAIAPGPRDRTNAWVQGVACQWTTSRPVTLTPIFCEGVVVSSPTSEPVDVTCNFDNRVLGVAHIVPAS